MTEFYHSYFDERWNKEKSKNDIDISEITSNLSISMCLSILFKQEILPTEFINNDLFGIIEKYKLYMTKLENINEIITQLKIGNPIVVNIHSSNAVYNKKQSLVITSFDESTNTFSIKDPYLYTTKYTKAIKENLVNYKTPTGSVNLISNNDALKGFDIFISKHALEEISNTMDFYSISDNEKTSEETPIYIMKITSTSKVSIRKLPSYSSGKICYKYINDIVNIYELADENWARTDKGWIQLEEGLILNQPVTKVLKEKTNIRKYPNNNATKLGRYNKDAEVKITQVLTDWVRTNKGWILSSSLTD